MAIGSFGCSDSQAAVSTRRDTYPFVPFSQTTAGRRYFNPKGYVMTKKPKTLKERFVASAERKLRNRQRKVEVFDRHCQEERNRLVEEVAEGKAYLAFVRSAKK